MNVSHSDALTVNARVLKVPSNGQKRVAEELISRLDHVELLAPASAYCSGVKGHLWEQVVLPLRAQGARLWSPSTTGPIAHGNHIVTVHDIAFVDGREWFSRSFATAYDLIVGRLTRSARHIITVSHFTRWRLIEHYGVNPEKVTAINSGVTANFFRRDGNRLARGLERFGIGTNRYLMTFLGSDPRKNTWRVLEAWDRIRARSGDVALVAFGRPSNAKVFARINGTLPTQRVISVGAVSDEELACLYSAAEGFVFPSLYEGFGLPVVEAAACGCRVLTSNVSSLPEVAPPDSRLVDPLSLDDIGGAMESLLATVDDERARTARMQWTSRFSWETAAMAYQTVFNEKFQ